MNNNNILRFVPIYDETGKMIGYHEVLFCKSDQEIFLLKKECEKNRIVYEENLKKKREALALQEQEKENALKNKFDSLNDRIKTIEESIEMLNQRFFKSNEDQDIEFKKIQKKIDSLKRAVDSLLRQELSISYKNKI